MSEVAIRQRNATAAGIPVARPRIRIENRYVKLVALQIVAAVLFLLLLQAALNALSTSVSHV